MKHFDKDELWSQIKKSSASNSNTYEKESKDQENKAEPVESNNAAEESLIVGEQEASIDDAQLNVEPSEPNQAPPLAHDQQGEAITPNPPSESEPAPGDTPSPEVNDVSDTGTLSSSDPEPPPLLDNSNPEPASDANTSALVGAESPGEVPAKNKLVNCLSNAQPLDSTLFPHQPRKGSHKLPATVENTDYLLHKYNIITR